MNDRDSAYTDALFGSALRMVTAGVDPDLGAATVQDALLALAAQAKALKNVKYESEKSKTVKCDCGASVEVQVPNHEALAKTMAQTAKMIDETARLVQFCSGKADSRPEVAGLGVDVLKALTDAQLQQLMGWVAQNGREQEDVSERR